MYSPYVHVYKSETHGHVTAGVAQQPVQQHVRLDRVGRRLAGVLEEAGAAQCQQPQRAPLEVLVVDQPVGFWCNTYICMYVAT